MAQVQWGAQRQHARQLTGVKRPPHQPPPKPPPRAPLLKPARAVGESDSSLRKMAWVRAERRRNPARMTSWKCMLSVSVPASRPGRGEGGEGEGACSAREAAHDEEA